MIIATCGKGKNQARITGEKIEDVAREIIERSTPNDSPTRKAQSLDTIMRKNWFGYITATGKRVEWIITR